MFDHIQIKVSDLSTSLIFYKACLGAAGYRLLFETDGIIAGFGYNTHNMLVISQATPALARSRHIRLTFKMTNANQIKEFYQKALANGGTDLGAPGFRPQYGEGHYEAAVLDPDGHHIEAVMSTG